MTTAHQITDAKAMQDFVKAGNAYFTLHNSLTGKRVTYNVSLDKETGAYTVRAFTGTDNSSRAHYSYLGNLSASGDYTYAGAQAAVDALMVAAEDAKDEWLVGFLKSIQNLLNMGNRLSDRQVDSIKRGINRYKVTASALQPDDIKTKGFAWFWRMLMANKPFPAGFEFWHEGRCAKCAKRLTVPESIAFGYGPECLMQVGLHLAA